MTQKNKRKLWKTEQAADFLATTPSRLSKARSIGTPKIPYIKIGSSVLYDPNVLEKYVETNSYNVEEA